MAKKFPMRPSVRIAAIIFGSCQIGENTSALNPRPKWIEFHAILFLRSYEALEV